MGCDIHMVLERNVDGRWVGIDTFKGHESALGKGHLWPAATSRNYKRFAALAGVRGEGPEPRGVPNDVSETAQFLIDDYGTDGHSHSWLPLAEAAQIFVKTEYQEADSSYMHEYPASFYFDIEGDLSAYRLVFWFDN